MDSVAYKSMTSRVKRDRQPEFHIAAAARFEEGALSIDWTLLYFNT